MARTTDRPSRAHTEVAREAGLGRLSFVSVLAGSLSAYGAFAIVASIAGAILVGADADVDFTTSDWTSGELLSAVVTALVLLVAYLFGGYVAGRMARRSGVLNGLGVFALSLVAAAIAGGIVSGLADSAELEQDLRNIGVPTTWDEWSGVGLTAALLALAGMLLGAVVGGMLGERWHTKLVRRAADPTIGPAAELRREAEVEDERREERIAADSVIADEVRADQASSDQRQTVDVPEQPEPTVAEPSTPAAEVPPDARRF